MKGHPEVVDYLNFLLRGELAARDQYFLHSRRYEDFGLHALYARINHEMEEETQHADALLRRILFLEGDPDMRPDPFEPGKTTSGRCCARTWTLSTRCVTTWPRALRWRRKHSDYITRKILVKQQADTEEDHMYWLEKQLRLIEMIGEENYTQSRMGKDPEHG